VLIQIMTLFPEMFVGPFENSIIKKAREQKLIEFRWLNFREFTTDKHRMVDDIPYGGGSGMVLKPEPIFRCLQYAKQADANPFVILVTPQGKVFDQETARELSGKEHLIIICGHYEGFDERIRAWADLELSIGDYILTGGELPAMVISDAVARLIPGVLGSDQSALNDSFTDNLLDYPQYTRPVEFEGITVPEVLLSGHHANIEKWRRQQAVLRTAERRPDLLRKIKLTEAETSLSREAGSRAIRSAEFPNSDST
jgi:tRNA (guanine37-N1)-methyltransferase